MERLDIASKATFMKLEKQLYEMSTANRNLTQVLTDLQASRADIVSKFSSANLGATLNFKQGFGTNPNGLDGNGVFGAPPPAPPKQILPKEVLDANLPKNEVMRLSAVYELIETEADYCKDLSTIISFLKIKIRESGIFSERDATTIFSNVEQLIKVNQDILQKLQARRDQNPIIQEIGDIIFQEADSLKVYTTYAANYPAAMKLIRQLQLKPDVKELLTRLMNHSESRGLSLESFLIKPVQRICKYPLLLRELEKYSARCGNLIDQTNMQQASERIEAVVTMVNEATRHAEEKQRILDLEASISCPVPIPLGFGERKHLKDGIMQQTILGKQNNRLVVLFTDLMFLCKQQKDRLNKYELEAGYHLAELIYRPEPRESLKLKTHQFQFTVITSEEREVLILTAQTEDERLKWGDIFFNAFKDITPEHRSAVKSDYHVNITKLIRESQIDGTKKNRQQGGKAPINNGASQLRKQAAARRSYGDLTAETSNSSLADPEFIEISGLVYKRCVAATGQVYYATTQVPRQVLGKLPESYVVYDPSAIHQKYDSEMEGYIEDRVSLANGRSSESDEPMSPAKRTMSEADTRIASEKSAASPSKSNNKSTANTTIDEESNAGQATEVGETDDGEVLLELVPGYPDWRCVNRGDGNPYYFNVTTQETSWDPPGRN